MEIEGHDKIKKKLTVGDAFGEIALLYKTQRKISVKTISECVLWGINRQDFRKAIEEIIMK